MIKRHECINIYYCGCRAYTNESLLRCPYHAVGIQYSFERADEELSAKDLMDQIKKSSRKLIDEENKDD